MKHIVILGSSAAGVTIVEEIRKNNSSDDITLIALDGHYPYQRDKFSSFIANEITREDIFCRSQNFYEQQRVNLILDIKISRVNTKRKKIFTEAKEHINYDILIITDTPENRFPPIKGTNKEGVFGYKRLKDIDQMTQNLSLIETVAIETNSFSGLKAALGFARQGKEVILISS